MNPLHFFPISLLAFLTFPHIAQSQDPKDALSEELRALVAKIEVDLASRAHAERLAAHRSLGALGPKARPVAHLLVKGMMDPHPIVAQQAGDSLRKVDDSLAELAIDLRINRDISAVQKATAIGPSARALLPILVKMTALNCTNIASESSRSYEYGRLLLRIHHLGNCIVVLGSGDDAVNHGVIGMLAHRHEAVRSFGLELVPKLLYKKSALRPVAAIIRSPMTSPDVRAQAIRLIPSLTAIDTAGAAKRLVDAYKFNTDKGVRAATEYALKQFEAPPQP